MVRVTWLAGAALRSGGNLKLEGSAAARRGPERARALHQARSSKGEEAKAQMKSIANAGRGDPIQPNVVVSRVLQMKTGPTWIRLYLLRRDFWAALDGNSDRLRRRLSEMLSTSASGPQRQESMSARMSAIGGKADSMCSARVVAHGRGPDSRASLTDPRRGPCRPNPSGSLRRRLPRSRWQQP